ncbi:MAG: ABC transporter permease [Acidobacteriota bacterium]
MLSEGLRSSLRFARHHALSTIGIVGVLGLALGLGAALFGITRGLMLKPLPVTDADRLVAVRALDADGDATEITEADAVRWRDGLTSVDRLEALQPYRFIVHAEAGGRTLVGAAVTPGFFELFGGRAVVGHADFSDPEARDGIVLGAAPSRALFGGLEQAVGDTLRLYGQPRTVLGVLPTQFRYPFDQDAWIPMSLDASGSQTVEIVARLSDGRSARQAQAEVRALAPADDARRWLVEPYAASMVDPALRRALPLLGLAAFAMLSVAMFDAANLLAARAVARHRELAVRSALGADRRHLFGVALVEALVWTGSAAGLALAVAYGAVHLIEQLTSPGRLFSAVWVDLRPDATVAGTVFGIAILLAVVLAALSIVPLSRRRLPLALRGGGFDGSGRSWSSRALMTVQVALSCAVLMLAGVLARNALDLHALDTGVAAPDTLITGRMTAPLGPDGRPAADPLSFFERVAEEIEAFPGVRDVAFASSIPTRGAFRGTVELDDTEDTAQTHWMITSPELLGVLGDDRVLVGRNLSPTDQVDTESVALVDRRFAIRHFGEPHAAIGRRIRVQVRDGDPWRTIVGVVPDRRIEQVDRAAEPMPGTVFIPLAQRPRPSVYLTVRQASGTAPLPDLRRTIESIDTSAMLFDIRTFEAHLDQQRWLHDTVGSLFVGVGCVALLLAVVGLYGVITVAVRQRRREWAIRRALGADRSTLIRHAVGVGLGPVLLGVAAGWWLAWTGGQALESFLVDLDPKQPAIHGATAGIVLLAGLVACWLPARRAALVEPRDILNDW